MSHFIWHTFWYLWAIWKAQRQVLSVKTQRLTSRASICATLFCSYASSAGGIAAVHAWNLATVSDKLSENCSKKYTRCFVRVPVCRYGMLRLHSLIFHHFIKLALMVVSAYDLFFSGLYPKLSATPPNNPFFPPALSSSPNRVLQVGPMGFIFSCLKRREYWVSSVIWNIAYSLSRIIEHLVLFPHF